MEITTKQLRLAPGKIPVLQEPENELFGIWKDREDMANVEQFVRNIRKGRKFGSSGYLVETV